jgi:hypothetical protein
MLTKPTEKIKGQELQLTLDKTALIAAVSDTYFKDPSNWSKVSLLYKSAEGNQRKHVLMDASQPTLSGTFLASEKARDSFKIFSLEIQDKDGGIFKIDGSVLGNGFDIDFAAVVDAWDSLIADYGTGVINPNWTPRLGNAIDGNVENGSLVLKRNGGSITYETGFSGPVFTDVVPAREVRIHISYVNPAMTANVLEIMSQGNDYFEFNLAAQKAAEGSYISVMFEEQPANTPKSIYIGIYGTAGVANGNPIISISKVEYI